MTLPECWGRGGWHTHPTIPPRDPMIRTVRPQDTLESYHAISAGSSKMPLRGDEVDVLREALFPSGSEEKLMFVRPSVR